MQRLLNFYMTRKALPFWIIALLDCALVYLAGIIAYAVNHSLLTTVGNFGLLVPTLALYLVAFVIGFRLFHTYAGIIRQTTMADLARVGCALLAGVAIIMAVRLLLHTDSWLVEIRFSDLLLQLAIAVCLLGGIRVGAKVLYDLYLRNTTSGPGAYGYAHKDLIDLEMADLLERQPITIDMEAVAERITGRCIMVTGAAGSIGSELVYLLAQSRPSRLVLIDQAESPLHAVRINMERLYPEVECRTVVTSICHTHRMDAIIGETRPDIIFHAAAYKHVPMMEDNPVESVLNNVDGTRKLADLAAKHEVKRFVMISTDKAVNPTSVMGCSKRICEIYCQSLNNTPGCKTEFITTRFGNVLGSNGSVIPLFRNQIRRGGPVLVTHPDIIRYFMLIPEACSLVLQAATMGHGGEIFVFDMGSPVRISDLARRMIALSGRYDIEIKYTGLRPGEKLYEELLADDEKVLPTTHPKIKTARVSAEPYDKVCRRIDRLINVARTYDDRAIVAQMKEIVPEYHSPKSSPYADADSRPHDTNRRPDDRDDKPHPAGRLASMARAACL